MTTAEASAPISAPVFAPAKINLTLHVTGQRADGYHLLESLVVFADVGDRLWIAPADTMSVEVSGPFADGVPVDARNLVWQAAELARSPCHIHLQKNLPHGAGIGGGSSDAAAVLRHFGIMRDAVRLGADVPVCLSMQPQRMQGIGEVVSPVAGMPCCDILLVNPRVTLSTPAVFSALAVRDNPAMPQDFPGWPDAAALAHWLATQRNDLLIPAMGLAPAIGDVLQAIRGSDALYAGMSGSGSTCFGVFASGEKAAAAKASIALKQPDWWIAQARFLAGDR